VRLGIEGRRAAQAEVEDGASILDQALKFLMHTSILQLLGGMISAGLGAWSVIRLLGHRAGR
jgi:hypothetical protein